MSAAVETGQRRLARRFGDLGNRLRCRRRHWGSAFAILLVDLSRLRRRCVELRLDIGDTAFPDARHGTYRSLDFACRLTDLLLQLLQFIELNFTVDVGLYVGDVALQPAEKMPQRARRLREPLGADDDQRHDG